MVGAAEMTGETERVMECALVDDEDIRLILRPELPFYPDQVSLRPVPNGVVLELREAHSRISFTITDADIDDPRALLKGSVVNLVEFPFGDPEPSRDTLIEISTKSL